MVENVYADEMPPRAYTEFTPDGEACGECEGFEGGWRWTSVPCPVHYNCRCSVSQEQVPVEKESDGTDTLSETEERQWVTTVPPNGSRTKTQTWSDSRTWTVYPKAQVSGEVGGVKVGGEVGGTYGGQSGTSSTDATTFNYRASVGGEGGQQVYAVYKVRTRQDFELWLYHWGDVTNDSGDEEVKLRKGAPYTERKFSKYLYEPIND